MIKVKLCFRGDSGFSRPLIFDWYGTPCRVVEYIVGLTTNSRFEKLSQDIHYEAAIS
ncbi:hypothetical protein QLQ86_18035 [Halomonas sp. LR5S13]|uniref:hypothetical protein n=1 Tax=Halomonas rhizosphaerae TaxID=3043296 RepID=UPI0024A7EDEC|nr:hypothetical protein [Halomonas rhizosphaerae]MDI5922677.1 hypothetical protein [Halomonas rhizosphaerae]